MKERRDGREGMTSRGKHVERGCSKAGCARSCTGERIAQYCEEARAARGKPGVRRVLLRIGFEEADSFACDPIMVDFV